MWPILLDTDVRLALRFAAKLVRNRCHQPRQLRFFTHRGSGLNIQCFLPSGCHDACSPRANGFIFGSFTRLISQTPWSKKIIEGNS